MDIVYCAVSDAREFGATTDTQWAVVFSDNKELTGSITHLNPGYRLNRLGHPNVYFSPAQVVRLIPIIE